MMLVATPSFGGAVVLAPAGFDQFFRVLAGDEDVALNCCFRPSVVVSVVVW